MPSQGAAQPLARQVRGVNKERTNSVCLVHDLHTHTRTHTHSISVPDYNEMLYIREVGSRHTPAYRTLGDADFLLAGRLSTVRCQTPSCYPHARFMRIVQQQAGKA